MAAMDPAVGVINSAAWDPNTFKLTIKWTRTDLDFIIKEATIYHVHSQQLFLVLDVASDTAKALKPDLI